MSILARIRRVQDETFPSELLFYLVPTPDGPRRRKSYRPACTMQLSNRTGWRDHTETSHPHSILHSSLVGEATFSAPAYGSALVPLFRCVTHSSSPLEKMVAKRKNVAHEVLHTEREYTNNLTVLIEVICFSGRPFSRSASLTLILSSTFCGLHWAKRTHEWWKHN